MAKLNRSISQRISAITGKLSHKETLERYHKLDDKIKDITAEDLIGTLNTHEATKQLGKDGIKPDNDLKNKLKKSEPTSNKKTINDTRENLNETLNSDGEKVLKAQENTEKRNESPKEDITKDNTNKVEYEKISIEEENEDFDDLTLDDEDFDDKEPGNEKLDDGDSDERGLGGIRFLGEQAKKRIYHMRKQINDESDYSSSILNEAIDDPVVRYAIESGNREFLRDVKKIINIKKQIKDLTNEIKCEEIILDQLNELMNQQLEMNRKSKKKINKIKKSNKKKKRTTQNDKKLVAANKKITRYKKYMLKHEANMEIYRDKLGEYEKALQEHQKLMQEKGQYEYLRLQMIKKGEDVISFDDSMFKKIVNSYIYFRALENLDIKFLEKLSKGELSFNDYKNFADKNYIDIATGGVRLKTYHDWIESKHLG